MEGRFKPLFRPHEPNLLVPKIVDGPVVGYWDISRAPPAPGDLLSDIPPITTLVYADGTVPGTGRRRPYLWAKRVAEEIAVFEEWVRRLEQRGEHVYFRGLRLDDQNPRVFHCYFYPPGGGRPIHFKIKVSGRYPEIPPTTEGLALVAYGRYRKPGSGEPCLGPLGEDNWRRNWRRWGIAHFLGLIAHYLATKPEHTIRLEEHRGRRRR